MRPKCQADLLKQKFQEEKYSSRVKTENDIQKSIFSLQLQIKLQSIRGGHRSPSLIFD
jgi:hypothetical protein